MFSKRNLKNPKQKQQQLQQHHHNHDNHQLQQQQQDKQQELQQQQQERQQRQEYQQQNHHHYHQQLQQTEQQQQQSSETRKEEININSRQISESLIVRATTPISRRLRCTVTRPFLSAEPRPYHSKGHHRCYSDDTFYLSTPKNFTENGPITMDTSIDRTITTDRLNNIDKNSSSIFAKSQQKVKKCGVSNKQTHLLPPLIINDKGML
ncbi:unnamed protein product [Cercopithifilaria johnstoni]|uniref:Uncharacterized protein n=1 Tax=Cercopithifilaria johnstoni TaxID=2874296 RepID=A0A8J2MQH9_9BILA|nr:unnamed protein product [Cercopithifilaria johnstoni]